jgi:2'-hydroxyisoflavone reductase
MRILIIGGTAFVGRHIAQAALDAGHQLTLFHRGRTGPGLFPQAAHLTGDRDLDLHALRAGRWDATVDVCGYLPRQVEALTEALDGRGGRQLFISSTSVYQTPVAPGFGEDAPLAELADPFVEEITGETYGGLKVACEQTLGRLYGAAATVVRPTYVIGPYDHSGRFAWWVERLARGGAVLAPGDASDPIQVIDAPRPGQLGDQAAGRFGGRNVPRGQPAAAVRLWRSPDGDRRRGGTAWHHAHLGRPAVPAG